MEGITEEDEIYRPVIKVKNIIVMPDIKTAIEMTRIANRFDEAYQKIKLMTQEEKEESIIKVNNWKGYSERERQYLLYKLYENTMGNCFE